MSRRLVGWYVSSSLLSRMGEHCVDIMYAWHPNCTHCHACRQYYGSDNCSSLSLRAFVQNQQLQGGH